MNFLMIMGFGLIGAALFYFSKKMEGGTSAKGSPTQTTASPAEKVSKAKTSQDFLLFKNIENNMIVLDPYRYRALIKIEPINWALKTFDEQDIIQHQFMQVINGLRYPVDLYIARLRTNIKTNLEAIDEAAKSYGINEIEAFGEELREWTTQWVAVNSPLSHGFFFVVYYDDPKNVKGHDEEFIKKQAMLELNVRCETLCSGLSRMGLNAIRLDDVALAQLIMFSFNRDFGSFYNLRTALQKGTFSLAVTSNMDREAPVSPLEMMGFGGVGGAVTDGPI